MRQNVIVDDQLGFRLGYDRPVEALSDFVTSAGLQYIDVLLASGQLGDLQLPVVDARGKRRNVCVRFVRAGSHLVMVQADPITSELLALDAEGLTAAQAALADAGTGLKGSMDSIGLAVEAAGIGMWEVDFSTGEMKWDERMCRLHDLPDPGFVRLFDGWDARIHPDDRERVAEETLRAIKSGRSRTSFRIFKQDGSQRHLESFAQAVTTGGNASRLIGLCIDVTERRVAELRELHRNQVLEALLRGESEVGVLETLIHGLEEEDPACRIAFMRIDATGRRLRSAAGPSLPLEYLLATDNLEIREGNGSCGTTAATRRITIVEDVLVDPSWLAYVDVTARSGFRACWSVPIIGAGDKLLGTLGAYYRDPRSPKDHELRRLMEAADFAALAITRKLQDEELGRRERLLEMTGAIAGVGGWELDLTLGKKSLTMEMARMHGLPPGSLPAPEEFIKVYTPESQVLLADAVEAAIQDWKSWHLELELARPDNGRQWVWSEGRAEVIDGEVVRLFGAVRDLSAEKVAEREREKLQEQLIQAQKMESVGRLAGGVAHDFNNILSVILGHAELAMGDVETDTQLFEDLTEIKSAAERSAALTQQLLAFARRQPIMPRKVNINDTIGGMVNMLRRLIGEQISLDWYSEPGLWDVYVDPAQVDQILANLCVNARDAIGGPGTVEIHTSNLQLWDHEVEKLGEILPGEYVSLTVRDNGVGISTEDLPHVFEPFFTTKSVGEGTGLGLSTVYGIVRQNHGAVTVSSERGQGTSVTVYLPRVIREEMEPSEELSGIRHLRRCRVLLVEDEPALLKLGRRMLEGLGHEVFAAARPSEAVKIAADLDRLDLLVTDIIMPEMNGRQLSDLIETHHGALRKLFISGYAAEVLTEEGALSKGTIFLQKPFSFDDFKAHVTRALEGFVGA